MAAAKRFVILATPRSGSNWLCTLLDSHPDILCHHELFNPDGVHIAWSLRGTGFDLGSLELQREQPLTLLKRTWNQTRGHSLVGFKLNIDQSEVVFSAVLDDPGVRKILVTRENRIRAFVSERIAEDSGHWESYPESPRPANKGPVFVDPEALKAHARRNAAYLDDIRQRLTARGQRAFELSYEKIETPQAQSAVLEFLGADPGVDLEGHTRRMNPEPLDQLVKNLGELSAALEGDELFSDLRS